MGLLQRLLGRAPERRDAAGDAAAAAPGAFYGDGWSALANMTAAGGGTAGPEGLSSVLGAVELIASALASLPASLTADSPDGQVPAPPTATAWALLRRPNPRQSWPAFLQTMAASTLLRGNGLAYLRTDGRGAVAELVPVPWQWIAPTILRGTGREPRLAYDVAQHTPEAELLGIPRRMLAEDVLHLRARSDDGIIGRSVLSRAQGVVREGSALAGTAEALWVNGLRPSGVITHPGKLSERAFTRLRQSLAERYAGPQNAGKNLLFEEGMTFARHSLSSIDAQFLQSREFSVAEVARLFNVPLGLLQPGQGGQALDQLLALFAQLALAPLVAVIEAEFDAAVLPPGLHLQLDMAGLLRGAFSAQASAFSVLVQSGIITANDAREALGWPAHKDGGGLRPAGVPGWPADMKDTPSGAPKPGKVGDGPAHVGTHENEGAG